jgi:hypothetical protein
MGAAGLIQGGLRACREPNLAELCTAAGRSARVVARLQRAQRQIEVSLEAPRPAQAAKIGAEGVRQGAHALSCCCALLPFCYFVPCCRAPAERLQSTCPAGMHISMR